MPQTFNPFSGLGKIDKYVKWSRMRGKSPQQTRSAALKKFGNRWGKKIDSSLKSLKLSENVAIAYQKSGPNRSALDLTLPKGQQRAKHLRITGAIKNPGFRTFGSKKSNLRYFVIDVNRAITKRQIQTTLRDQILDAFFSHYEIANKYKADFRKRFGEIDVTEIEGI